MDVHIKNRVFYNIVFPEGGGLGTFKLLLKNKQLVLIQQGEFISIANEL